jgi:hypothetical protein
MNDQPTSLSEMEPVSLSEMQAVEGGTASKGGTMTANTGVDPGYQVYRD